MITKRYGVDFHSDGGALTLPADSVTADELIDGSNHPESSRTHESGWTIKGTPTTDWCSWLNDFEATHPVHGKVWGNFETEVHAETEEGFNHFYENHPPEAWDYWDI